MGRPRVGVVIANPNGSFSGRVRMKDGKESPRFPLPETVTTHEEAKAIVLLAQRAEDRDHTFFLTTTTTRRGEPAPKLGVHPEGSADAWFARYNLTHDAGANHRRVARSAWKKWISPVIGKISMAKLTKEDVERVRDRIDAAVAQGVIESSTPTNIWSVLTSALTSAWNMKDRAQRVHGHLPGPLHKGVLPPAHGDKRKRPFLYPNEFALLIACEDVPRDRREAYALATFVGPRPNELRVLTSEDIELGARLVHITRAWDVERKVVGPTKTPSAVRSIPIHEELVPLLARAKGGPLVTASWRKLAVALRRDLRVAGVRRPRLFRDGPTERAIDFRSLRDTYLTWRALEGADILSLKREAGHVSISTTDGYIKAAASYRTDLIGRPFPPLGALTGLDSRQDKRQYPHETPEKEAECMAPTAGLEPKPKKATSNNNGHRGHRASEVARNGPISAKFTPTAAGEIGKAARWLESHLDKPDLRLRVKTFLVILRREMAS